MNLRKLFLVCIGSVIMGLGIRLTIAVNLGSDPMTLFWIGISNQLHITVGQANLLVCAVLLVFVFFMDRTQIHLGSLLNPICIALTTNALASLNFTDAAFGVRMVLMILGLMILAFGVAFYALADYGKGAYEALVFTLCNRFHLAVGIVRTGADILFAFLGVCLSAPFSIGTFLAIVCMGSGIQMNLKFLNTNLMQGLLLKKSN